MNDRIIESMIQEKGKTAPRITQSDVNAAMKHVCFFTAYQGVFGEEEFNNGPRSVIPEELRLLTFCVIVLMNGFTVTGESACASPENFDPEIGKEIAFRNAQSKIWSHLGYELRTKLCNQERTA